MTPSTVTPTMRAMTPPPTAPSKHVSRRGSWARRIVSGLLIFTGLISLLYAAIALYFAPQAVYKQPVAITMTPAMYGLAYQNVTFASRVDHVRLEGWFIPGVLPNGRLTADRTIIMIGGRGENRTDMDAGAITLSATLAHHGFAVLAFDARGTGVSQPEPLTMGYFEQRDVLGAVDFLKNGSLPYPDLGRPRIIAGWGVSSGATSMLYAAAQEPAIRAVVSDTSNADAAALLERRFVADYGLPGFVVPGGLVAARLLYGVDFFAIHAGDIVGRISPRPLLFIQGDADPWVPRSDFETLVTAAQSAPDAHVQTWIVPGVHEHAQAFHVAGDTYSNRVIQFFATALGPDASHPA